MKVPPLQFQHYQTKLHLFDYKYKQNFLFNFSLPAAIRIYGSLIRVFIEAPSTGSPDTAGCNTVNCNTIY